MVRGVGVGMRERILTNSSAAPDEAPIAFVDSGVGGLPYLDWVRERLPGETFVYWADRANFPYGPKTPEEVAEAVSSGVAALVREVGPKLVVVACNTASVVALARLRREFPDLPFVGTVPAVKPAALASRSKKIGVWATERTIRDSYLDDLVRKHAAGCEVVRVAGPGIVDLVENRLFESTPEERGRVVAGAAEIFRGRGVDQVVLGCTHFIYEAEDLRRRLGAGVGIMDSREGVGGRVLALSGTVGLSRRKGRDRMYLSGSRDPEPRYRDFAARFRLEMAGVL